MFVLGQLLFSIKNFMAIVLLCFDSCFCTTLHKSIWKWAFSIILRRV